MTNFFSNRTLRKTTIGSDQSTTRLSTTLNVGCAIEDVSISKNHMLIIGKFEATFKVNSLLKVNRRNATIVLRPHLLIKQLIKLGKIFAVDYGQ